MFENKRLNFGQIAPSQYVDDYKRVLMLSPDVAWNECVDWNLRPAEAPKHPKFALAQ
jgi:hypothetical protein